MRRTPPLSFCPTSYLSSKSIPSLLHPRPPIINIDNATFYRNHPSSHRGDEASNPLFPGLNFSIPSFPPEPQHWAILGASSSGKTTILEILRGQHLCFPPTARSFPYLSSDWTTAKDAHLRDPGRAIQYIGFSSKGGGLGEAGTRGAYLSARYESWKEKTDFSLLDYLKGNTSLYPLDNEKTQATGQADESAILEKVVKSLHLEELLSMPVVNLSNGQSRRARIAKALMDQPEALLLDEPFSTCFVLNSTLTVMTDSDHSGP